MGSARPVDEWNQCAGVRRFRRAMTDEDDLVAPFGSANRPLFGRRRASPLPRRYSGLHQHLDRLVLAELHGEASPILSQRFVVA